MINENDIYAGVHEYPEYTGDFQLACDAVVVGSGPTGAVVAYNLAEAGFDVVLLEAGPIRRPSEFVLDAGRTLAESAWEGGVRAMRGNPMLPTIQGRVLGGSSLINSAMCIRTPQFCFDDWRESWGVQTISRETLDPHYDRVERFLGIRPTEEHALGQKNILFKKACDKLGWHSEPTNRNVVGCDGAAECFTGCPTRAKRSMDITYVPEGIKKGLRVYTSVMATRIEHQGGRVTGLRASVVHPRSNRPSYTVNIRTRMVVLGAGCLHTPVLLQKSSVADPHQTIGKNLQCHPGAAVLGLFEQEVNPWEGATQGYHSLEFIEKGFKLEVLWAPAAVLAVRLPDFGDAFKSHLANFRHGAIWDAIFSMKHSFGRVRARRGTSMMPDVTYRTDDRDMPLIREGLAVLMEMFVAAGAHTLLPGIHRLPSKIPASEGVGALIRAFDLRSTDLVLASTHLFSSTRMGPDPRNSVVDETGELHHLKGCSICDTGVMPRSPAVNPMLTGMALADKFSYAMQERLKG